MAELLLLALLLAIAALGIAWPLLDGGQPPPPHADAEREARLVRHRLAIEALRDVEADRRAGSLDDAAYATQRAEAEARAAETLAALDAPIASRPHAATGGPRAGRRLGALLGLGAVALVLIGFALPAPVGIAERTVTNQALADAIAREDARQAEIERLLGRLAADGRDADALSDLADAYLAGGSADDLPRAAVALLALIGLEPENASAYRRLITAYINADDWTDARAALDAYAGFAASDEPDIPFFRGLIALRADGDEAEAVRQFDRFLEMAPHDPRAAMVLSLRESVVWGDGG